jgi:hypothetical protein
MSERVRKKKGEPVLFGSPLYYYVIKF